MEAKKEIFLEAKSEGLDVKILKLRKFDQDALNEREKFLGAYLRAMNAPMLAPVPGTA